ncbi:zinc finger protein Paris-like [Battus philenor]|uniref:zinc finger protein Paris-like n=1 Tax=Battus philenor TaxID=42288 RepID=UPI0035D055B3
MDITWSKDRLLKIFSTESLMVHANATGDCGAVPAPTCRLCGGGSDLRRCEGTYLWNGTEENYELMLYECFGVEVPRSDCMICDHCIHQLRSAQRFRNIVKAAFVNPSSEGEINSNIKIMKTLSNSRVDIGINYPKKVAAKTSKPKISEGYQKRGELRRDVRRPFLVQPKKANVLCSVCNQRYPMIVPFDGFKKFVCSRCKKNAETYGVCRTCNLRMPMILMNDHMKTHEKVKKGKSRSSTAPKMLHTLSKTEHLSRTNTYVKYPKKYQCSHCQKRYMVPHHLASHINNDHGDLLDCTCTVCGRDLKTREMLDKHMRTHTGQPIYQCHKCMKIFKSQRNLQSHYAVHEKR